MTAVMERVDEVTTPSPSLADWEDLRRTLAEQKQILAEQTQMLRALDARREELEELVVDMMPVVNDAMLLAIGKFDALSKSGARAWLASARQELEHARRAPTPSWGALFRQFRAPDVRRALSLLLTVLQLAGRAATAPDAASKR
ncbi:MAG: DUF1641 domain-containing protein [Gemmatimonadaceae bacterium]